jgi:acetyl esterase/lipase
MDRDTSSASFEASADESPEANDQDAESAQVGEEEPDEEAWTLALSDYDFSEKRRRHQTALQVEEPSPQSWSKSVLPDGVSLVQYQSEGRKLNAWLAMPTSDPGGSVPGVVYLHGGFAFGASDFEHARRFVEAGYAVLVPQFRGENGQEGHFELMYGEVMDALAAVKWFASRPEIDAEQVFTFGHSIGANISAMLSLFADAPVRLTAGAGGLYHQNVFFGWERYVRFNVDDDVERQLRVFTPHLDDMHHPHVAYMGAEDSLAEIALAAQRTAAAIDAPLTVQFLQGDHFTTHRPAIELFIDRIEQLR